MFNVTFYTFSKKENSTKRPTETGTSFNCILKEPSGILNPTIALNLGLADNPSVYNYCYIATFNRYYYINEWSFENALWYANLSVDPLATAKEYIGNHDFYILRSSAASNGRVMDTKYPTLAQANSYTDNLGAITCSKVDGSSPEVITDYFSKQITQGFYYLGITGGNATGVSWYCLRPDAFNLLVEKLYNFEPQDMQDVSAGVAKVLANPMQYIVTCYWLPFKPSWKSLSSLTLKFGNYSISNIIGVEIDPIKDIVKSKGAFNIRKHPQAATRGLFLNNSPYSNYTVQFNPFGSFTLDASLMVDDPTVDVEWYIDYSTGYADLTIKATNTLLANTKGQLGVPIQLNQATVDYMGMATGAANMIGGFAGSLLTGDIAGAASSVVGGFAGVAESKQPKITTLGGTGSFLPYNTYIPKLYSDFYHIADEFNAEIGRPLCEIRKPSAIAGYMMVLDGSITAPLTKAELQDINNYLMGGFFYE